MRPQGLLFIVSGKRYNTATSTLLAEGSQWDGLTFDKTHKACFLYRTSRGNYYVVKQSWEGRSKAEPLTTDQALELFHSLEQLVSFEMAFPAVSVEEA